MKALHPTSPDVTERLAKVVLVGGALALACGAALISFFPLPVPKKSAGSFVAPIGQMSAKPPAPIAAIAPPAAPPPPKPRPVSERSNAPGETESLDQLRDWARKYPESAVAWGQRQSDGPRRIEVLSDACFQIAQTDPMRALQLAESFYLDQGAVLKNLAQQWAEKDLDSAYHWVVVHPPGEPRSAAVTGVAFVWSRTEPVKAAGYVVREIPPGPAQDEATIMVLHQWALSNPADAYSWVQRFPAGPLRDRALKELGH